MASHIKRGESILIPFRNGQSISDSQLKPRMYKTIQAFEKSFPGHYLGTKGVELAEYAEVVRCKDCRWAKPYERTDGKTGYYCHFCGHSFKYGMNWERLYSPIKESDDFCSYGERREEE